ncbi:nucleotidyltransferase domain-containing protein [Bosea caraganae]|uniref:Nucleotidyltransferase domain-containing protein n=1 Tax=Bosea caraganae TaxID=2763117 RepID=A0A370L3C5_9HYPH|nr:nucleotidyltransferase domain-containing protein [Bosea caraganae]RDJ22850.1 nucleotidyltransferase domain-containing protein [Bosea caraganae]RDJ28629.1 nucleotidyltransferase domain-containing protein [Bosea caraganae]
MSDVSTLLAPPSDVEVAKALAHYFNLLAAEYGSRLAGVYLFGSRARRDHRPDSDADIAVVLTSFQGTALDEKMRLVDLGFEALTDAGVMIQPWPFTSAEWEWSGAGGRFADLLVAAKRDAKPLEMWA